MEGQIELYFKLRNDRKSWQSLEGVLSLFSLPMECRIELYFKTAKFCGVKTRRSWREFLSRARMRTIHSYMTRKGLEREPHWHGGMHLPSPLKHNCMCISLPTHRRIRNRTSLWIHSYHWAVLNFSQENSLDWCIEACSRCVKTLVFFQGLRRMSNTVERFFGQGHSNFNCSFFIKIFIFSFVSVTTAQCCLNNISKSYHPAPF